MPDSLSQYLQHTIDRELPHLRALTDEQASHSLRGGWTRKQELGHLIDSAANNHVRFVVATLQKSYQGSTYDPDGWVALHGYSHLPWPTIVDFWYQYNSMLAQLIWNIAEDKLEHQCEIGDSAPISLGFLIEDYVLHMQHHIDQLMGRDIVTKYPA